MLLAQRLQTQQTYVSYKLGLQRTKANPYGNVHAGTDIKQKIHSVFFLSSLVGRNIEAKEDEQ